MSATSGGIEGRDDGHLVKVIASLDNGRAFLARAASGGTATFSIDDATDLSRGEVIFVTYDASYWEKVPDAVWPELNEAVIVRSVLSDGVVIETGVGIRILPEVPEIPVSPGNTVEYNDADGIIRVISETPLRYRDAVANDELPNEYLVDATDDDGKPLTFASFGGYHDVRRRAVELIETQLGKRENLKAIGARPVKGVIFTGPPGTGKTYLARIIANESKAAFYLVSGPTIVGKYVGESEDTLRRIFDDAAKQERAIIFFDEIDSIAERRTGESHEASKRLVAQLLTRLDGFDKNSKNVVVIAATNRIEDVDEALLRPGRFDWEIPFGDPTPQDRLEILEVGAQSVETTGDLQLQEVAKLTDGWSAARLSSIWTEAGLVAAGDDRQSISVEDVAMAVERVSERPARRAKGDDSSGR